MLLLTTLALVIPLIALVGYLVVMAWPVLSWWLVLENPKKYMTAGGEHGSSMRMMRGFSGNSRPMHSFCCPGRSRHGGDRMLLDAGDRSDSPCEVARTHRRPRHEHLRGSVLPGRRGGHQAPGALRPITRAVPAKLLADVRPAAARQPRSRALAAGSGRTVLISERSYRPRTASAIAAGASG